jgi:hypothetical protein
MKGVILLMLASMGFGATVTLMLAKPSAFAAMIKFALVWIR